MPFLMGAGLVPCGEPGPFRMLSMIRLFLSVGICLIAIPVAAQPPSPPALPNAREMAQARTMFGARPRCANRMVPATSSSAACFLLFGM